MEKLFIAVCDDCGEKCELIEETIDYAGTHCTFGKSGTYHTGNYVSACCLAEWHEEVNSNV